MTFSKKLFLYILIGSLFISCHSFDFLDLFGKTSDLNDIPLLSRYQKKESINEEALEKAKKSVWEVSLYINFKTNQINILEKNSQLDINIEDSHSLIHLGHGSGFFISPSLMVTNFHVIDKANEHVEIISNRDSESDGELIVNQMRILKVSALYDLALLESETDSPFFLDLKREKINSKRDSFFLLGYPDNRFILSPVQFNSSYLSRKLLFFNRKADLGDLTGVSGGPIIDQNGKVAAVNQSGSNDISIGVSHTILDDFLNGNNRDCSQMLVEDCLQKEWRFLDEEHRNGNSMAKHIMSINTSYENWLNKKEKLNDLIENRQKLNEIEEKFAVAMERYSINQNRENKKSYQTAFEEYQAQIEVYNKTVSDLNDLFF